MSVKTLLVVSPLHSSLVKGTLIPPFGANQSPYVLSLRKLLFTSTLRQL